MKILLIDRYTYNQWVYQTSFTAATVDRSPNNGKLFILFLINFITEQPNNNSHYDILYNVRYMGYKTIFFNNFNFLE